MHRSTHLPRPIAVLFSVGVCAALGSACTSETSASTTIITAEPSGSETSSVASPTTASEPTNASSTTTRPSSTTAESDGAPPAPWLAAVDTYCRAVAPLLDSIPIPEPSDEAIQSYVTRWRAALAENVLTLPAGGPEVVGEPGDPDAMLAADAEELATAAALSEAGDLDGALVALDRHEDLVDQLGAAFAVAGGTCDILGPDRARSARLNLPLLGAWQIASGFDSIWVARQYTNDVIRLDPTTGAIQATVDVGSAAFKMQPADGVMWIRTDVAYVAVDPATNAVARMLLKSDVGPLANRAWAVDGALWVCDGPSLRRYDPTTLQQLVMIDLGFDCGQVYAQADLVVAWSYNEDEGESGTSAAALIDPATNEITSNHALPFDVGVPVVLPDTVFFHGYLNDHALTIDRPSGTVTITPDLGRVAYGSQPGFDGNSIYVPAKPTFEIVVIDPKTFAVTDVIHPLGVNSLTVSDDALWVANNITGYVQAFDI